MSFNWFWGRRSTATGFPSRTTRVHSPRCGDRKRSTRRRSILESLEKRTVLTTFYVDANLALVADRDSSGGLSAGDQVTFGQGQTYEQANLTYDAAPTGGDTGTAFSSISQALASSLMQDGDTIDIAGGTYTECVSIDKAVSLQGLGNVVLQAAQANVGIGISVIGNPNHVTLGNLTVQNFATGIGATGGNVLELTDVTLLHDDAGALVTGVTTLSVTNTSTSVPWVWISPNQFLATPGAGLPPSGGPTPGADAEIVATFGSQSSIYFSNVSMLNVKTGPGSEQYDVTPLANTVVNLDAGDPAPPTTPGDGLWLAGISYVTGNLSIGRDASGFSGTWTLSNTMPVSFKHFETLPGTIQNVGQGGQDIEAVEGVDTGSHVLASFRDANTAALLSEHSADVDWGDGKSSAGTISYDAATGTYSVSGSHIYDEEGTYRVSVVVHSAAAASGNTWIAAPAVYVSEPPIAGTGVTIHGTEGEPLAPLLTQGVDVAEFSHGSNVGSPSEFSANIDWGDGTTSTNLMIEVPSLGTLSDSYLVIAPHTYHEAGAYTIKVMITDDTAATTIVSHAIISERPLPGGEQGTSSQRLVAEFYEDLLNRQIDADALTYWAAKLDAGVSRQEVVAGIQNSDEYRHDEINVLFQTYLHRGADQGALDADNKLLLHGETLEQLAAIIVSSEEYFQQRGGGTNDGFLAALFQDALDRQIDDGAKASFEQELAHGVTRAQIADHVFGSKEYRNIEVQNLYQQALDRDADQAGVAYWTDKLAHGMRDEQALAAIMGSQEYFDKTQQ